MTSPSHLHTYNHECSQEIHTTIPAVIAWTKHNNFTLNPAKTTFTLFSPDPVEYTSNLHYYISNGNSLKCCGSYLKAKTQIQYPHSQQISTCTQTSTNNKRVPTTATYKTRMMQNPAKKTPTGCTQDTNTQHLHNKTRILPKHEHL